MFGALRRFGAQKALRVSMPQTSSARWTLQSLKWQPPSTQSFALKRSLHMSFSALQADSSQAVLGNALENEASDITEEVSGSAKSDDSTITNFADLESKGLISPSIIRNITHPARMGLTTMTDVQSQTINQMLRGEDVLAQAKTGTGKTLAFLVPSMQNILNDPTFRVRSARDRHRATDIRALIISPTRELAEQIAEEARKVARGTGIMVQTAVGGTQKRSGLMKIQREGCHLLIGTPGRLKDILSDPRSGVSAPKLNTLILDEVDRLLDQGFYTEIEEIFNLLPNPGDVDRQTLMLSATVPRAVMAMVDKTMKPDYTFVKTVRENETPTHLRVPQKCVVLNGYENALPAVLEIAKNYQAQQAQDRDLRPFKAIVYFNSTLEVKLAAEVFSSLPREATEKGSRPILGRLQLHEIHSRLSQSQRTNSANSFKRATEAILFSSDVTARGMDFPDVTHVIQIGVPRDRETYIHRIGRTARANKTGEGWIFYHANETNAFLDKLGDLPLVEDSSLATASLDMTPSRNSASSSALSSSLLLVEQVKEAMKEVAVDVRESTYRSMVGVLVGTFTNKRTAIQALNNLAINGFGLSEAPSINPTIARNLGLTQIREANVARTIFSGINSDRRRRSFRDNFDHGNRHGRGHNGSYETRRGGGYGSRSHF